ncbi:MAG: carbon-nitrogen hydrolase family protein [Planctomycetaceae bacterium]
MRIAAAQIDIEFGNTSGNLDKMLGIMREVESADLVVFPECALTGYCFESLEEGREVAEPVPGPATQAFQKVCRELNMHVAFGMLEADGDDIYNAAVLVGPNGVVGSYRKVHMPFLGIDRFATYGNRPFELFEIDGVKIGMLICYDVGFPEAPRCLALQGADIVLLPTNWPPGAECMAEHSIPSRAMENSIFFVAVDRVGVERGTKFIGMSSICGTDGKRLAAAMHTDEEILICDINPERARNKRIVRVPSKHIIDRIADRRPEMYGKLVEPHNARTPRQDFEDS